MLIKKNKRPSWGRCIFPRAGLKTEELAGRRLYIYELFNCFDCEPIFVNGKLIRISQEARQKGKLLKRCYNELLETVDAYFLVGAIPDLEKMRTLLARFDKTWVDFEKLYFEESQQLRAKSAKYG